jgi:hypothetical protein
LSHLRIFPAETGRDGAGCARSPFRTNQPPEEKNVYQIERKGYGFKLTFSGFMKAQEMEVWKSDSEKALAGLSGKFGVLVDMRALKPLPADAQAVMVEGQKGFKAKGMERSAVILDSAVTTAQFRRLAKESGIYAWERYVSASDDPGFEQVAESWITRGIDPDQ